MYWSDEENRQLKEIYALATWDHLINLFGRARGAILMHAGSLRLKRKLYRTTQKAKHYFVVKNKVERKGGTLPISLEEYTGVRQYVNCMCSNGHTWKIKISSIMRGRWCPHCFGRYSINLDVCKKLAHKRGGKCLSIKYFNHSTQMTWSCAKGHVWKATYNNIKIGSWCPYCCRKNSFGEAACRKVFECLLDVKFNKQRPAWLINPETNRKLELDGYNASLKLAFEYQGSQHYWTSSLIIKQHTVEEIRHRDKIKLDLCKHNNVQLIKIPYFALIRTKTSNDKLQVIVNYIKRAGIFVDKRQVQKIDSDLLFSDINKFRSTGKCRAG